MRRHWLIGVALSLLTANLGAENWPHWRGPLASGVSSERGLPTRWSDSENVAWKASIRGVGISSPIVWRDLATNEEGYRIYARRQWFDEGCEIVTGPYVLVDALPAGTRRYVPPHRRILRMAPIPATAVEGPGEIAQYRLYVSAYNEAGETPRVFVGGFTVGLDTFCDEGLPGPDVGP